MRHSTALILLPALLLLGACAAPPPSSPLSARPLSLPSQQPQPSISPDAIDRGISDKPAKGADSEDRIFMVRDVGVRTADIYYGPPGSTPANMQRGEVFHVDAGLGGDIELAVVRRIIVIIRRDHSGDIDWNSRLLKRPVKISVRPKDSAELVAFLRKELFSREVLPGKGGDEK